MQCGMHRVSYEEPDLLVVRLHGFVSRDEMAQILDARSALTEGLGHFLILCDLREFTSLALKANRLLADRPDPRPQAVAFVGASFRSRVLADMTIRAASIFAKRLSPHHFCREEGEARAWLDGVRQKLVAG